ncbi:hypothetical protein COV05_03810 [Candidatus Uhrbacteria bacterium CG10_big_fil_rev_8_21_14_0_10_48_16]|uniref:Uracil-DNA glycosylase-like domain-containing protein n=1 Tax=Candidatus Uhrbacteria bacterium CG10_big_fil_rev_8_21_14_0_10_48_16 TaxID=1975038 RepID=A0A2M8LGE4_9BACT|nr:MAG: hypothetical protein COV05_03810 [Candidatus Uhrbacteria bacterium CG10_big_fil_rev_8_21_14_0_10_48_16]
MIDIAKSLGNVQERKNRIKLLDKKHVSPLVGFVEQIRNERGLEKEIPDFDPLDGGVNAECLFLLEAPGPQSVQSGFVSRNNPDETAKNFFEFNQEVGIPRRKTIIWNIVPWYIGNGKRIRAAKKSDIQQGLPYLQQLLTLLPRLKIIVLVGKKAQTIKAELAEQFRNLTILTSPHPSPMFVNRKQQNRNIIFSSLRKVKDALDQNK